jgi:hypothetical protein
MMTAIQFNNTLEINEIANAIKAVGAKRTVFVEGDMGSGKTSILKLLSRMLPTHVPIYLDATTKDLGDLMVPMFDKIDDAGIVRYALNEELGFHHKKPVILMIDEYGKANPAVKNGLLRVGLERKIGDRSLPEGSIVFMTSNLGAEGVGDLLLAHQRNRIVRVRMRKSSAMEWIENFARPNGIHPSMIGWVKDTPKVGESFTDVDMRIGDTSRMRADEINQKLDELNPYIFHPKAKWRTEFFTWRSAEAASDILWAYDRNEFDKATLTQLLIGTIGERATRDMQAFIALADDLPKMVDIQNDPMNAKIPEGAAAQVMVVDKGLATLEYAWVSNWMKYLGRMPREVQGLFVNTARKENYNKRDVVTTCKEFGDWCLDNGWLYSKDQ